MTKPCVKRQKSENNNDKLDLLSVNTLEMYIKNILESRKQDQSTFEDVVNSCIRIADTYHVTLEPEEEFDIAEKKDLDEKLVSALRKDKADIDRVKRKLNSLTAAAVPNLQVKNLNTASFSITMPDFYKLKKIVNRRINDAVDHPKVDEVLCIFTIEDIDSEKNIATEFKGWASVAYIKKMYPDIKIKANYKSKDEPEKYLVQGFEGIEYVEENETLLCRVKWLFYDTKFITKLEISTLHLEMPDTLIKYLDFLVRANPVVNKHVVDVQTIKKLHLSFKKKYKFLTTNQVNAIISLQMKCYRGVTKYIVSNRL